MMAIRQGGLGYCGRFAAPHRDGLDSIHMNTIAAIAASRAFAVRDALVRALQARGVALSRRICPRRQAHS